MFLVVKKYEIKLNREFDSIEDAVQFVSDVYANKVREKTGNSRIISNIEHVKSLNRQLVEESKLIFLIVQREQTDFKKFNITTLYKSKADYESKMKVLGYDLSKNEDQIDLTEEDIHFEIHKEEV